MKEDILEQLVDDYLQAKGYFTRHNLKFRPSPDHRDFDKTQDSSHSDIDVLGVNPLLRGSRRVVAVSCKSWQSGFNVRSRIAEIDNNKIRSGRESWKTFRELVRPKWSEAFVRAIHDATGSTRFTYILAVTVLRGDPTPFEHHRQYRQAMRGNPIQLLSLKQMSHEVLEGMNRTLAGSQLGRTLQLLRAAGVPIDAADEKADA